VTQSTETRFALPEAHDVSLGSRGSTRVWDSGDTDDPRPPLLLLHGWNIDAPANFGFAVPELSKNRRVVMYDHHGHGHGCRTKAHFSLDDAAADAVRVLDELGITRAIVVGYSMGGAIAQLFARHSPERCAGVVLVATANVFCRARRERAIFATFAAAARSMNRLPGPAQNYLFAKISASACRKYPEWILQTVRQADPISLLEAGESLGDFDSTSWVADLTPPVAAVVTRSDTVVSPRRQVDLATRAQAVHVQSVEADHDLPINDDPRFAAALSRSIVALDAVSLSQSARLVDAAH